MNVTTKFNGYVLDDYIPGFRTLSVSGREFNEVEIDSLENVGDGSMFLSRRIPQKEITVSFMLKKLQTYAQRIVPSFEKAQELLLRLLNYSEEKQLIFSDESDRYYMAMFSKSKLEEKHATVWSGTLTFVCSDPYRHSLTENVFTAEEDEDGELVLSILNGGNVAVPIDYVITMNSDNGYVGLICNNSDTMQFGFLDEADGEEYTQSEIVMDTAGMFSAANDPAGTINQSDPTIVINADALGNFTNIGGRDKWLGLKNDTVVANKWHGGQRTIELNADSEGNVGAVDFECYFRRWFQKGRVSQIGFQSIFFLDENKNIICGTRLGAYNQGDWSASLDFYVSQGASGRALKTISATANDQDSSMWRSDNGHDMIRREGGKFTFYYGGKYYSWDTSMDDSRVVRYIQICFANYKSVEAMTRNLIGVLTFTKMNVSKWQDNPNRYASGDVMSIDGKEGKVYVNGMPRMGDEIAGTKYFKAQPGTNTIKIHNSTWASAISVDASIREAWL